MRSSILLLLALIPAALAQTVTRTPAFIGASRTQPTWTPTSISKNGLYLTYLDLPLSFANFWTNQLGTQRFTNQGTAFPSNTPSGVYFSGAANDWMKNSTTGVSWSNGVDSVWITLSNMTFSGSYKAILATANVSGSGLYVNSSTFRFYAAGASDFAGTMSSSIQYDVCIVPNGTNWDFYTNGVINTTGASRPMTTPTIWGIGHDADGDNNVTGYIKHIAVFTNYIFSSTDISNLHYYAVNTSYPVTVETNWFRLNLTTVATPETFTVSMGYPNGFKLDWGDGTTNTVTASSTFQTNVSHSYSSPGNYTLAMQGQATLLSILTPNAVRQIVNPMRGITGLENIGDLLNGCANLTGVIPSGMFDYATSITNVSSAFAGCRGLTNAIPTDLFKSNTAILSFYGVFIGTTNLSAIPTDLFRYSTHAKVFDFAFYGPLTYQSSIKYIPTNIFDYNTEAVSFTGTFYKNGGITNIPIDLFRFNTAAKDMSFVFANAFGLNTTIPEDLFRYNTEITNASYVLHASGISGSIPTNLFKYNSKIVNLSHAFNTGGITNAIPPGLFDYCTNLIDASSLFEGCRITSIPESCFKSNVLIKTFASAFSTCTALTSIPNLLFDSNTAVTNYNSCFYSIGSGLTGNTPQNNSSTELWNLSGPPSGTNCFFNDTGLGNYGSIPAGWK